MKSLNIYIHLLYNPKAKEKEREQQCQEEIEIKSVSKSRTYFNKSQKF